MSETEVELLRKKTRYLNNTTRNYKNVYQPTQTAIVIKDIMNPILPRSNRKIPLKTILCDKEALHVLTQLVFDMNDLVIHTYQFIRMYLLHLYKNNTDFPTIDDTFILYCMKTLGTRDNRGKKSVNTD